MNRTLQEKFTRFKEWAGFRTPVLNEQESRFRYMERNITLPIKIAAIAALFYYFYFSNWYGQVTEMRVTSTDLTLRGFVYGVVRHFFLVYVVLNAASTSILLGMGQVKPGFLTHVVFATSAVDGLFLAGLTLVTGGADSILFWGFMGLVVRNAISHSDVRRSLALNIMATFCYVIAGGLDLLLDRWEARLTDEGVRMAVERFPHDSLAEPFLIRIALLGLLSLCCHGLQVLVGRERRARDEAFEFSRRQDQLQAAGRLAAEIAHQLKNPLGIINNAAFTLQRTVKEGKTITQQLSIIREEVERSDRILTELMGYARLSEGQVERLEVVSELEEAVRQVFPPGAAFEISIHRDYAAVIPPLLMQRAHLRETFVNLLQNAREILEGRGNIWLRCWVDEDFMVRVSVTDSGPGIPPEKLHRVFEAYFTTKPKGTGLGLAIVKHNVELYNGSAHAESSPGRGACFVVALPARTSVQLRK